MAVEIATLLGIDSKRLRLEWISSAEGARFAEVAREFIEQIEASGPSPLSPHKITYEALE